MTKDARASLRSLASTLGGDFDSHGGLRGTLGGLSTGALFGVVALLVKIPLVEGSGGDLGYVLYVAAIGLAAWFRGLSGGVGATLVTAVVNTYLFIHPGEFLPETTSEQVRLVVYVVSGVVVASLFRSLRTERDQLALVLAEQVRLSREIADRDERLELVLAASRTGIWETDLASGKNTWSDQLYEQVGRSRDTGAVEVASLLDPGDREQLRETIRAALVDDRPFTADVSLQVDGSARYLHIRGRAFREEEQAVRIVGTSEDVTERVEVERQRAELEAQEQRALEFQRAFIDVLSHELRTPMTTIYAAAEMLRRPNSSLDERDRHELLGDIHDETGRLQGLIENLLVLSRAQRDAIELADEPVDLRRAVESAVRTEAPAWPDRRFGVELPDELPIASGSDAYVVRVLANLLSNAGKYSRPGGDVLVTAETSADEVSVRVLDRGVGLDGDPDALFALFYREPGASRYAAGSGVGLFVCARLVEAMGGRIWGRVRDGGGAEFGFALPRHDRENDLDVVDITGAPASSESAGVRTSSAAG